MGLWKVLGSEVPKAHPRSCFPSQFDLQRTVIYCDSRHAELETCCDIPSGPVSKVRPWRVWEERRGFWVLGPGREEASGAWERAVGVRGTPVVTCDLGGGPVVTPRDLFTGPVGSCRSSQGHAVVLASVPP